MAFAENLNEYLKSRVSQLEAQAKASQTFLPGYTATSSSGSADFTAAASSANDCVDDVMRRDVKREVPETREEELPSQSKRQRNRRLF